GASQIGDALRHFQSVKRRMEVKAEIDGITIIDDFAHHPTAIAATLRALRTRYAGRRLWVIFEPRSNTLRRKIVQQELVESLLLADQVIVASVFKAAAIPEAERMEVARVVSQIGSRGGSARQLADADAIVEATVPEMRSGDVVAVLSNG